MTKPKDQKLPPCGRDTVQCRHCGHHRKVHAGKTSAVRKCSECAKCPGFEAKPCEKSVKAGRSACRKHGGATPTGPMSPNWRTGKYSKYMPKDLAARAEAMLNNEQLVSLDHDIALLDTRMAMLLESLGTGGDLHLLARLDQKLREFKAAAATQGPDGLAKARVALDELEDLIRHGRQQSAIWGELYSIVDVKRKVVGTQGKVRRDLQDYMPVVLVVAMMRSMSLELLPYVVDRTARAAIAEIFDRFSGGRYRPDIPSG